MADKRLDIVLTVTDKGTVKIEKSTKAVKTMERQVVKSSKSMVSSFAKVGGAVIAAFGARAIINATNNFISQADKIAKTAGKIGVASDALQELQFAAERSGLSAEAMANNLEKLNLRLAEARDGTGELKKITDQYGIAVLDASGKTRKAEDVLGDIAELIAKTGDAAEKTRITYNAFGRSGVGMINALKGGREGLAALRKEARDTGNIIDSDLLPGFEAARDAIDTAGGAIRTTFINAIGEAAPEIKNLADEIRKLAADEGFKSFVTDAIKLSADLVKALASIPKALTDIGRALRGEQSPLRVLQESVIAEAERTGLFDNDRFISLSLLSLEGGLRAIAKAAPGLLVKAGLDPASFGRELLPDAAPAAGGGGIGAGGGGGVATAESTGFAARLALNKQFLEQRQALRMASAEQELEIITGMNEADKAGADAVLAHQTAKEEERQALLDAIADGQASAQVEYVDGWRTAEEERTAAAIRGSDIIAERELALQDQLREARDAEALAQQQRIDAVAVAMGNAVAQIVVFGKSGGEVFKSLFQSFAAQIITYLVKTTVQYIAEQIIQLTAALTAFTVKSAQNVSLAATTAGASAAAGGPIAIAAAAAAASAATITAGTAAFAAGQAAFGTIGAAHGGLTNVPSESTFLLNKGERVLSPNQNKDLTSFLKKGGGNGGRVEFVFLPGSMKPIGKLLWQDSRSGNNRLAVT